MTIIWNPLGKPMVNLLDSGFSIDEINAESLLEQKALKHSGFSDAEIQEELGIPSSNWVRTVNNVNQPTLSTITERLDSGFSPYMFVGGRQGRFNFDVPKHEDDKTPGTQYQFEAADGNNWWFQLENDYQGGRWDEADHAKTNYEEYKTWSPETRKELLNQMWAGSPEIADFINNSVLEDKPWEEVIDGLEGFNTYRQISNFDVTGLPEFDENLLALLENTKLLDSIKINGLANIPELVIPEDADEDTKSAMQLLQNYINLAKASPELLTKEWDWSEIPGKAYDSSVIGLIHELIKVKNGDKTAAKNAAEMFVNLQAFENQPWLKQRAFNVAAIGNELPIMIPAGKAGVWACAPAAAAASAAATPLAGAAVIGGCSLGAAFGAPAFLRSMLMDLMNQDIGVEDEEGMLTILLTALETGGIEMLVGILTGVTGGSVGYGLKTMGVTNKIVTGGATLTAETFAMVSASGALHGYMPTWNNFVDTALELLVLRGGNKGVKETTSLIKRQYQGTEFYVYRNLQKLYAKAGIDPRAVKEHIKDNPELARELIEILGKKNFVMPEYYVRHVAEVMNRLEQVSRSTIKVGDQDFQVSRYYDAKNGTMEVLSQFLGEAKGMPDKITFQITKEGNWTIKDAEGGLSLKGIQAIADFAESKGRQIVQTEGFDQIYKIIEMRQDKVETLDPRDKIAIDLWKGVKQTADELRNLGKDKEADEILAEGRNLLEQAVGKDYFSQAEVKVAEYQKFVTDKEIQEASSTEYKLTGFHPPETIFKNTFGVIDELKIPEHDIETELIVTHATKTFNVADIAKNGMDVAKGNGFLHFGTDVQAKNRGAGITDPTFLRVQVKYNKPLDARIWENFDEATEGLGTPLMTARFLRDLSGKDEMHPAKLTVLEYDAIRNEQGIQAQSLKLADILKLRGYDAIIYKNEVEAKGDSVAILDNNNIRVLGYAKSADVFNFTGMPESKVTPKGTATDGGYNLSLIEGSVQANKIMTMPALVEIVDLLMDGKLPGIYKNLGEGTRGSFQHIPEAGKESGKIKLRADIFQDPKTAAKTVAHEIGHMVDWLEGAENYTMSRGNILGRLASLKKYLNTYMEGRPGGRKPLTQKEKNKLRYAAQKFIKEEVQSISNVKEIKDLGITPQQIKDIFTGVMKRADVDPQIYSVIQKAGSKLKSDITKAAMRGKIHPEILKIITSGKEEGTPKEDIRKRVLEKYHELFQKEVLARELLSRDVVMEELKKVTQQWRPFDENIDPKYTKYRHSTKELYADFFSALMTNPQFAKITAPTAYEGFFNFINSKPTFKKAYDKIQAELTNGETLNTAESRIREGFKQGEEKFFNRLSSNEKVFAGKGKDFAKILFQYHVLESLIHLLHRMYF